MFASHVNAIKLNQNDTTKCTDDGECTITAVLTTSQNGLSARRPTALALSPINTTSSIDEIDCSEGSTSYSAHNIDIGFSNLAYTVRVFKGILRRENQTVLNGINGEFKSGELTAIMGSSGAGKSTLLDVLAGYTVKNVNGQIMVNGRERDLKSFRKKSAYIMQDHELRPLITVMEAMYFSVNLKIGDEISQADKRLRIKQILKAIGLYEHRKVRSCMLSGGQKKRLTIALEIVDNPPVMFFDEPTSGLDSSTATQVVLLLKKLAQEGRTIITTIHQPSPLVFGLFDHLFAMAKGRCIYTGATTSLVPFLAELNLICPESYSPSDYLLEISTDDYGYQNDRLVEKIKNGKETIYRRKEETDIEKYAMEKAEQLNASGLITPVTAPPLLRCKNPSLLATIKESPSVDVFGKCKDSPTKFDASRYCQESERYATTFFRQVALLLSRTFLITWRDPSLSTTRMGLTLTISLLIGTLYLGIGNEASNIFNNFSYVFFSIMFLMFTAFSAMTLCFPLEMPIVMKEHFNRWYSLKAYYVAISLAEIPIQIICVLIYICITYFMTSQPPEFFRMALFSNICLMAAFVASSLGLIISAIFDVKNCAIFGPFFICPFLIFSGYFIHLKDAHQAMHWLFHISFLKYALEGASLAIFGYDRPKMDCDEYYCHYVLPKKFMKTVDLENSDYGTAVLGLGIIFLILRIMAYFVMAIRLKYK